MFRNVEGKRKDEHSPVLSLPIHRQLKFQTPFAHSPFPSLLALRFVYARIDRPAGTIKFGRGPGVGPRDREIEVRGSGIRALGTWGSKM